MQFDEILAYFQIQKRYGDKAQARCPCHDDKQASLTITKGRRSVLIHCHAGCNFEDIIQTVGLKKQDLYFEERPLGSSWRAYVEGREHKRIEAVYNYVSYINGEYAFTKIRMQDKRMIYGVLCNGRFTYGLGGRHRKDLKSVYGDLKALNKAIAENNPVFIPEGEKDADTLTKRGYTALTYGGSGDWQSEFATLFKGAEVYILADNDEPGRKVANTILSDLKGIAKSAKIIVPVPDIPKADISDYFAAGHGKEEFEKLIQSAVTDITAGGSAPKGSQLVRKLVELDAANKFPLTDIGSATLFSTVFENKHRYNVTAKDWFYYDGQRWILDREGLRARKSAKELSKALSIYAVNCLPDEDEKHKEQYLKYALTWTYSRTRNAIIQDSRDLNFISNEELDADDYVLNLQNCVLVFREDKVEKHEHSADLLLSKIANAEYRPEARCERWEQFLDEVMQGDKDKIHYLQKLFGTCLTGDVRLEKMWFLFGSTTRNGKSTMIERIADVLGDYSKTIRPETLAIKNNPDSRTASPDVAKLAGTRLCVCSEIPKRMPLDVGLLKTLTGRDTIVARFLHQDEFQFVPKFKMICNTNFLPVVSDNTIFKSDRVQVVSFDRHFEESEQDKTLKDKLSTKEALSGILNWMIKGWIAFCREGLEVPEAIKKSTTDYEASSDKLQNFINECLAGAEGKNISVKETYARYEKWCSENGYHVENKQNFISDCKAKGIYKERGMVDGSQVRNIIKDYEFVEDGFMEVDGDIPFK